MTDIEADLMIANAEIKQLQARLEVTISGQETLQKALATSQRRERAAVDDMKLIVDAVREEHCDETCCFACKFDCDTSITDSGDHACECPGFERDDCFEWRGPQDEDAEEQ
jgi:hypothetical protein